MALKKILFGSILLLVVHHAEAQFGVNVRYSTNNFNNWSGITRTASGGPIFENHLELGLDYWFKPNEYRAEYLIELSYGNQTTTLLGDREYSLDMYTFGVKSNLYILDFRGDCDCPTFKKEGNFLKKGFFLQWSAHAGYWQKAVNIFNETDTNLAIDIGGGIGIDIGVSDLLTITPVLSYQYFPWLTWEQFGLRHGIGGLDNLNAKINADMIKFGIRVGLRPDFLKEQRVLRR